MELKYLVTHCTATPEGREVTSDDIKEWHQAPREISKGRLKYNGKIYDAVDDLPSIKLNGHYLANIRGRGWDRLGYSDMIHLDGCLENLTPFNQDNKVDPWEITWGAYGINSKSRHIVYVGGLREEVIDDHWEAADTRTKAQVEALGIYYKYMILRHPDILIVGHNDFSEKACPCFDVSSFCREIGISEKNIYKHGKQKEKK